jgi:hypothetical protein
MKLIYYAGKFKKFTDKKYSDLVSRINLKSILSYNFEKKEWGNPSLDSLSVLERHDFLQNKNEFLEKKWILLRKANQEFAQEGPYSSSEIVDMLSEAKLHGGDFIWKTGFSKWIPVGKTETFKGLMVEEDLSAEDLLENVMLLQPEMRRVEDKRSTPLDPNEVFIILDEK